MSCSDCKDSILNSSGANIPDPLCQENCPEDVGCADTISSTCVIYQGADIDCLNVENGQSVTEVVEALGVLCNDMQNSLTSCKVKTNADDTCCDYLDQKIQSTDFDISVATSPTNCKYLNISDLDWTWTNIVPTPGYWASVKTYDPTWATLQYGVKRDEVQLKGGILRFAVGNTLAFTLPLSVAPSEKKVYQIPYMPGNNTYSVVATVTIATNGQVRVNAVATPLSVPAFSLLLSLDGIRYII